MTAHPFNVEPVKAARRLAAIVGAIGVLALAGTSARAADDPIVMKLSHAYPTVAQHHKNALWFKKEIEERTDGRIVVDIFPASQLMPITQEFNGLLSGQIDAAYTLNTIAATLDPLWGVLELPFLFDITASDQDHLRAFVKSEDGGGALKESMKQKGITVVAIAPTDYVGAMINTKRPITRVEDFEGLKVRIPGGKYLSQSLKELGASPIAMAYAEFSPAIVQGTVDGTVTGVLFTYDNKIPVDHLSQISLWYAGLPLVMSNRFFDRLPQDLQEVVLEVGAEMEDMGFDVTEESAAKTLTLIAEEMGVEVQPPLDPAELARMKDATRPVLDAFAADNPDGAALIEEAERLRAE